MAKLTLLNGARWRDLNWIAQSDHPLWCSIPPERADPDLRAYQGAGFVIWTGHGWIITEAGRAALALPQSSAPDRGEG